MENKDFDFLKKLTDRQLEKRLDIIREQQGMCSRNFFKHGIVNIDGATRLKNQADACVKERMRRLDEEMLKNAF